MVLAAEVSNTGKTPHYLSLTYDSRAQIKKIIVRFVSSQEMLLPSERPITPASIEVTKKRMTDLAKRNAVIEEFKTLDEDIKTVKKLKIMVEVFERIKRENPAAYDRMVRFFEENEKAHRLRRVSVHTMLLN